jgi:ubiquinone/menaquinone biosynthesis C-methylase UbiE
MNTHRTATQFGYFVRSGAPVPCMRFDHMEIERPQTGGLMTNATTIWQAHARSGATPAEHYERYFVPTIGRPFAVDLVRDAALHPGERVLDVGCGTGLVARLAAREVGQRGAVAGLDVNPQMLAVARRTADGAGIQWYETGAESIPIPDEAFDVVLCQLSLQFMTDKSAALSEMRRMLRPQGRALLTVPLPNPLFERLDAALVRHVGQEAGAFVRTVFSLNEPDRVETLLRDAGFESVEVRTARKTLRLPPAGEFLWQYVHSTPLARSVSGVGGETLEALERDVVAAWQPWSLNGVMSYEQGMLTVTGQR